jgi:hypothetical protein
MSATTPTHPREAEPEPQTDRYEATSLGLSQYIKRCKQSSFPLKSGAHEFGFLLTELDKAFVRIKALEAALEAKTASRKPKDKEA